MRRVFFTFVLLLLAFQSALAWTHGSSSGGSAPSNTALPVVTSSSPVVGTAETATNGSWTGSPTSYTYVWKAAGTVISGATASTYVPVSGDIGKTITATVTAVKTGTASVSATSAATAAVIA